MEVVFFLPFRTLTLLQGSSTLYEYFSQNSLRCFLGVPDMSVCPKFIQRALLIRTGCFCVIIFPTGVLLCFFCNIQKIGCVYGDDIKRIFQTCYVDYVFPILWNRHEQKPSVSQRNPGHLEGKYVP